VVAAVAAAVLGAAPRVVARLAAGVQPAARQWRAAQPAVAQPAVVVLPAALSSAGVAGAT
jgi:hypothetical protein